MTTPINDGGPAFPRSGQPGVNGITEAEEQEGMRLRDWFAGMALQAIFARFDHTWSVEHMAAQAYATADAMIAERERGTSQKPSNDVDAAPWCPNRYSEARNA